MFAPAGTPKPIVERMHAAITKAGRQKDVSDKFVDQFDMEVTLTSVEAFTAYIKKEQELWGKVIRDNNLRAG